MARSHGIVRSHRPQAAVFAFVSDFRHAPLWDPQTRSATKLTDGPIGVGTRFVLLGGAAGMRMALPYEVVAYDSPRRVVLEGSTRWLWYRDEISFEDEGQGTRIDYAAQMELRSVLRLASPLMPLVFARIAGAATRAMAEAIDRHVAATLPRP